jgi:hypothetical protein
LLAPWQNRSKPLESVNLVNFRDSCTGGSGCCGQAKHRGATETILHLRREKPARIKAMILAHVRALVVPDG